MTIHTRKDGDVFWIEIDRQNKANAIDVATWKELLRSVRESSEEKGIRVIALKGSGSYFSAGEDLSDLLSASTFEASLNLFIDKVRPVFEAIMRTPKVVISVVNGPAIGVGAELVFASDIALMKKDAYLSIPQVRLGVGPPLAMTFALPVIGKKRLFEMALTGKRVEADQALEWGIVNAIYEEDPGQLVAQYADMVKNVPESLVRLMKESLSRQLLLLGYEASFRDIAMYLQSEAARNGIRSFFER